MRIIGNFFTAIFILIWLAVVDLLRKLHILRKPAQAVAEDGYPDLGYASALDTATFVGGNLHSDRLGAFCLRVLTGEE